MGIRSVLFYRDFIVASGGHQKVFDYFNHLINHRDFQPAISFSPDTVWDTNNPWYHDYKDLQVPFEPLRFDALFLGGMDWERYQRAGIDRKTPVINLIQHVRHAEPSQPMHKFLREKAIRICVSPEVQQAIRSTGVVNGPIFSIPNGIEAPVPQSKAKNVDVFISGVKRPSLALELKVRLESRGITVDCETDRIPKNEFLHRIALGRVSLLLPGETEGFYLPALEAMALADLVVVPDCVGNRGFCIDFEQDPVNGNCLFPTQAPDELFQATLRGISFLSDAFSMKSIGRNAKSTVATHGLDVERKKFFEIVRNAEALWSGID